MIKAAINGVRTCDYHAKLPFSAVQAALEGAACIAEGAKAIHVHVWTDETRESLHADDVARFLNTIRAESPNTPVGISTGEWIVPKLNERLDFIKNWHVLPDFVSLNFNEQGVEQVADALIGKGIAIEAGLANERAAKAWAAWNKKEYCLRILLEPNEVTVEAATENVIAMEAIIADASPLPRLLHGLDETTWPMLELAAKRGYDSRIGFEDSVFLPDGTKADSNAQLVAAAVELMSRYSVE